MSFKIVDSHQHVNWHQRDTAGLIKDMDEHGIAYAWLLTWFTERGDPAAQRGTLNPMNVRTDGSEEGITLQDIVQAKEKYPDRFVVGYCPNPRWPNAALLLRNAHLMHGAKICGEWKYRMLIDDPRCLEIFIMAGKLNMPVVLHLDVPYLIGEKGAPEYQSKWYGGTIANLERAMQACPQTKFIGHAPGFWREISADAQADGKQYPDGEVKMTGQLYRLFDAYPNLSADLSASSGRVALQRSPRHAVEFLNRYSDRLLFGRDCYGQELNDFLLSLPLDPETRDKIYFENAEKLVASP